MNKVQLKKQLHELGIKVEGNYVKKKELIAVTQNLQDLQDLKRILALDLFGKKISDDKVYELVQSFLGNYKVKPGANKEIIVTTKTPLADERELDFSPAGVGLKRPKHNVGFKMIENKPKIKWPKSWTEKILTEYVQKVINPFVEKYLLP